MNWYCVKCDSDNVVEDVVMSINNNDIHDVIQDTQRCGDCNYEVLEQRKVNNGNNNKRSYKSVETRRKKIST